MANTYKNIVITPNTASSNGDPTIQFSGGNTSVNTDIYLRVYPTTNGTLSIEGSAGQLFSITNDLTGSIYSINDVSGIPSLDVNANGTVALIPYGGSVAIGSYSANGYTAQVTGTFNTTGNMTQAGNQVLNASNYGGYSTFTGAVYGTIFYDYNNAAYYCDPNGTSVLNAVTAGSATFSALANVNITGSSSAIAGSHLQLNNGTGTQTVLGFTFGGVGKGSIRVDNGGNMVMNGSANNYWFGPDTGATSSYFYNGSSNFMSVTGNVVSHIGNVVIGSAITSYTDKVTIRRFSGQSSYSELLLTDGTQSMWFNSNTSGGSWNGMVQAGDHALIYSNGSIGTGALTIAPWLSGTGGLRMDATGNVGIGAITPVYKLDVNGTVNAAALYVNGSPFTSGVANTAASIFLGTANNASYFNGLAPSSYALLSNVHYIGTTSIALNRASAAQALTGITSIDGSAAWLRQTDGTGILTPAQTITSSGSRTGDLAPSSYNYGIFSEFKNSSTYSSTGNYSGLITYAPWLGTTASTGDPSYQLLFSPSGANATTNPVLKLRAGIDTTWGAWNTILHSSNYNSYALNGSNTLYVGTTSIALNRASAAQALTGITSIDGTANNSTYLNGNNAITIYESLRANRNITGGGDITYDASANIYWSARFIVISNGRGANFGTAGYFDITCPTSGTITGVGAATNATATAAGIPLTAWQALYYILPIGSGSGSVAANFRISSYTSDVDIPYDWILICVRNGDDNIAYFNNGIRLYPGSTSRQSAMSASLGASGVILENGQTIGANYTMTTNYNGLCAGPVTINTGVTVTIPTGSNWVIM